MSTFIAALRNNLAIVGPPGSGKGSYGRHLAKSLGIPLLTVSDILRQERPHVNLASGQLVCDHVVSEAILKHLESSSSSIIAAPAAAPATTSGASISTTTSTSAGFLLDGFPRTLKQVQLMQDTWPSIYQVHAAISLDVPDRVCETKLLGRRSCKLCGGNYNCHAVHFDKFDLPASLPGPNDCRDRTDRTGTSSISSAQVVHDADSMNCNPETDWTCRPDDVPHIVKERLEIHHLHTKPVLEYFESKNRLLTFAPYKGYDDLPRLQSLLNGWLKGLQIGPQIIGQD
jgi:adenylate kinase